MRPVVRIERHFIVQCCGCEGELAVDHVETVAEARAFAQEQGWTPNAYGGWACPDQGCQAYAAPAGREEARC